MNWSSLMNNPLLKELPFKIELDKWGKILMSPASNTHGHIQYETATRIMNSQRRGKIIMECSIQTRQGVKVADVAWASDAFIADYGFETPYRKAPELCVEIVSPSNSKGEMDEKIELYLAKGAIEVWIVYENSETQYFSHEGQMKCSKVLSRGD